jgi:mannose-6-phosphate isomerase-like protein (cupin superfamily)
VGSPVAINMSTFLDSNFVGRSAQKSSQLACAAGGTAALIQLNDPLAQHAHADADEFLYVIAGEGNAKINGRDERLRVGVFVLVPRGLAHQVSPSGRTPLVMLSIRPGERCSG